MPICKSCGLKHDGWIPCAKAKRDALLTPVIPVLLTPEVPVLTPKDRRADRHSDGYMREYMRKRRAV